MAEQSWSSLPAPHIISDTFLPPTRRHLQRALHRCLQPRSNCWASQNAGSHSVGFSSSSASPPPGLSRRSFPQEASGARPQCWQARFLLEELLQQAPCDKVPARCSRHPWRAVARFSLLETQISNPWRVFLQALVFQDSVLAGGRTTPGLYNISI